MDNLGWYIRYKELGSKRVRRLGPYETEDEAYIAGLKIRMSGYGRPLSVILTSLRSPRTKARDPHARGYRR